MTNFHTFMHCSSFVGTRWNKLFILFLSFNITANGNHKLLKWIATASITQIFLFLHEKVLCILLINLGLWNLKKTSFVFLPLCRFYLASGSVCGDKRFRRRQAHTKNIPWKTSRFSAFLVSLRHCTHFHDCASYFDSSQFYSSF